MKLMPSPHKPTPVTPPKTTTMAATKLSTLNVNTTPSTSSCLRIPHPSSPDEYVGESSWTTQPSHITPTKSRNVSPATALQEANVGKIRSRATLRQARKLKRKELDVLRIEAIEDVPSPRYEKCRQEFIFHPDMALYEHLKTEGEPFIPSEDFKAFSPYKSMDRKLSMAGPSEAGAMDSRILKRPAPGFVSSCGERVRRLKIGDAEIEEFEFKPVEDEKHGLNVEAAAFEPSQKMLDDQCDDSGFGSHGPTLTEASRMTINKLRVDAGLEPHGPSTSDGSQTRSSRSSVNAEYGSDGPTLTEASRKTINKLRVDVGIEPHGPSTSDTSDTSHTMSNDSSVDAECDGPPASEPSRKRKSSAAYKELMERRIDLANMDNMVLGLNMELLRVELEDGRNKSSKPSAHINSGPAPSHQKLRKTFQHGIKMLEYITYKNIAYECDKTVYNDAMAKFDSLRQAVEAFLMSRIIAQDVAKPKTDTSAISERLSYLMFERERLVARIQYLEAESRVEGTKESVVWDEVQGENAGKGNGAPCKPGKDDLHKTLPTYLRKVSSTPNLRTKTDCLPLIRAEVEDKIIHRGDEDGGRFLLYV